MLKLNHLIFPSHHRTPYNISDGLEKYYYEKDLKFDFILSNSKLIINTYLGTSWYESIASNKPTILICKLDHHYFKKEFYSIFNEMVKLNLIFDDEKQLSTFVNNNIDKINDWYFSKDVQNIINKFKNEHMLTSTNYKSIWMKMMNDKILN